MLSYVSHLPFLFRHRCHRPCFQYLNPNPIDEDHQTLIFLHCVLFPFSRLPHPLVACHPAHRLAHHLECHQTTNSVCPYFSDLVYSLPCCATSVIAMLVPSFLQQADHAPTDDKACLFHEDNAIQFLCLLPRLLLIQLLPPSADRLHWTTLFHWFDGTVKNNCRYKNTCFAMRC